MTTLSGSTQPVLNPTWPLIGLIALLFATLLYDALAVQTTFAFLFSDGWEHASALRMLLADWRDPLMPHIGVEGPSARFIPTYVAAAAMLSDSGLDGPQLLIALGFFNLAVVTSGLIVFGRVYFRSRWAGAVLITALYLFWGKGFVWSNATALSALPMVAGFPSNFVFGLSFWIWTLVVLFLRTESRGAMVVYLGGFLTLFWLAAVSHLPTALFCAVGVGAIAITSRRLLPTTALGITGALALSLTELWPYFSTIDLVFGEPSLGVSPIQFTASGIDALGQPSAIGDARVAIDRFTPRSPGKDHPFYNAVDVLLSYGPALLGVLFAIRFAARPLYTPFVIGFVLFFSIYLTHAWIPLPFGHRALLFAGIFAHLALGTWVLQQIETGSHNGGRTGFRSRPLWFRGIFFVLLLSALGSIAITAYKLRPPMPFEQVQYSNERARWLSLFRWAGERMETDSLVLAPIKLSWGMASINGRVIGLLHPSPFVVVDDGHDALRDLFSRNSNTGLRRQIIAEWKPRFLLAFADQMRSSELKLDGSHSEIARYHRVELVDLRRTEQATALTQPNPVSAIGSYPIRID